MDWNGRSLALQTAQLGMVSSLSCSHLSMGMVCWLCFLTPPWGSLVVLEGLCCWICELQLFLC